MSDLFCMVCSETPCTCKPRGRRRAVQRATQVRTKPQPVPQTEPAEANRKSTRAARTVQAVRPPQDDSGDEDFALIEAVRTLAHIVDPRDLVQFQDHLMPSDLLPPEERRASWLQRVHRGATKDGAPA